MLPDSQSKGKDSVDLIRDSLFAIQVEKPWLLLQFGNSDTEEIGTDRVEALVSASPSDEDGETREKVVKTEIRILHAVFAQQHEKFLYPEVIQRLGIRTTERGVHLHTGHTCFRSWMQHFIPFLAALQVLFFHLFQSGKLGDVLHDQVHVDVAVLFCCSDILPGIVNK